MRLAILACLLSICAAQQMISCTTTTGSCSCTTAQGEIDLSPLAKNDGSPKFVDKADSKGQDSFSFNPCNEFTEVDCVGVATCQVQPGPPGTQPNYFSLGTQDSATFISDPVRGLELQYSADTVSDILRTSFVQLNCDPSVEGSLEVDGEDPSAPGNYYLKLTSKYCCPGGGPAPEPSSTNPPIGPTDEPGVPSAGFSKGGIVLIVFFTLLIVYFASGFAFMKISRKASGRESIPNVAFWTSIPGLIKDGTMFVVRRGKSGQTYNDL